MTINLHYEIFPPIDLLNAVCVAPVLCSSIVRTNIVTHKQQHTKITPGENRITLLSRVIKKSVLLVKITFTEINALNCPINPQCVSGRTHVSLVDFIFNSAEDMHFPGACHCRHKYIHEREGDTTTEGAGFGALHYHLSHFHKSLTYSTYQASNHISGWYENLYVRYHWVYIP